MSKLIDYVLKNAECVSQADDQSDCADMVFFSVKAGEEVNAETLRGLVRDYKGEWNEVDLFDGKEHSYIELGGWIGDQGLALKLMGLGALLGLWKLLTPRTMLGADIPDALAQQMAGMGLLTVQAVEAKAW